MIAAELERLETILSGIGPTAVAVSGGVDSMVLAYIAHRLAPDQMSMFHASSPAVPLGAADRIRAYASQEGWRLTIVDAGEFENASYRANPVDRCFYCKSQLYSTISSHSAAQIVSGTNTDDLSDYRPGLRAADSYGVRHPYVEANIGKASVRRLARALELDDLADLHASPCLSSRVETGIRIEAPDLAFIDALETFVRRSLGIGLVRCRQRRDGIVLELESDAIARLESPLAGQLRAELQEMVRSQGFDAFRCELYRRGSAFLKP